METSTNFNGVQTQLLAVSWGLTAASGIILALRVYCKFARHRGLWWDDYVLIFAWLCFVTPTALTTAAVYLGFGYHIFEVDPANLYELGLLEQFMAFFSILSALWSKTSFGITMLRITKGWVWIAVWFIIVSMNVLMLLSALFTWIQCIPVDKFWDRTKPGTCWPPEVVPTFNIVSGVYSGCMDIALALLPWAVILKLQMKKKEKLGVAIAMSMGVFAGVTGFIKSSKIPALASGDFTFFGVPLVVWGAAETATTIIATSIPVLRALFSDLHKSTGRYFKSTSDQEHAGTNGNLSNNNSRGLRSTIKNSVTVSSTMARQNTSWIKDVESDGLSDKAILTGSNASGGRIMRTAEVSVEYNTPSPDEVDAAYEMDRFEPPSHGLTVSGRRM